MAKIDKDEVLRRLNLPAYYRAAGIVFARTQGDEWTCLCPFHQDTNPSMSVNVRTGLWKCFACDATGDVFEFHMRMYGKDFVGALADLAEFAGTKQNIIPFRRPEHPEDDPALRPIPLTEEHIEQFHAALLANEAALHALQEKRGYTLDTIKRYRLGYGGSPNYSKPRGNVEYFLQKYHPRVTIPIYDSNGQLVNCRFYSPAGRKPKFLPWSSGMGAHLFPSESLQSDTVLLLEGEPDTMLACQMGYPAITQTSGATTFKDEWRELFRDKAVYVCYDVHDLVGAGEIGAKKVGEALHGISREVRIITLPINDPKGDFSDYILKYGRTKDDFDQLMADAPVYEPERKVIQGFTKQDFNLAEDEDIDAAIDAIPEALGFAEKYEHLRRVYRILVRMPPTKREHYVELIKTRFKLTKAAIRTELQQVEMEMQIEPAIPTQLQETQLYDVCLAQDCVDGRMHYTIWLPTQLGKWVPRLVTSDGDMEIIPDEYQDQLPPMIRRWSVDKTPWNVFDYIKSHATKTVDVRELYQELRAYLTDFWWSPDPRYYDVIVLWWMSTYIYMGFDEVAYLALIGTKRTGKTRLMGLSLPIAFNARELSDCSDAYLYRIIEQARATLMIDEADHLQASTESSMGTLSIIRGGYKRGGRVGRVEKDGDRMVMRDFSTYSPKMIANVTGLEEALEDRTLQVRVLRKPKELVLKRCIQRDLQQRTQGFRNRLYWFGLQHGPKIIDLYRRYEAPEGIEDREAEIWSGILCIAQYLGDTQLYDDMVALARRNLESKEIREGSESNEAQIVMALYLLVKEDKPDHTYGGWKYWSQRKIAEALKTQLGWQRISHKYVANVMVAMSIIDDDSKHKKRVRITYFEEDGRHPVPAEKTSQMMCYLLDLERVKAVAQRYRVRLPNDSDEEEEEDPADLFLADQAAAGSDDGEEYEDYDNSQLEIEGETPIF